MAGMRKAKELGRKRAQERKRNIKYSAKPKKYSKKPAKVARATKTTPQAASHGKMSVLHKSKPELMLMLI